MELRKCECGSSTIYIDPAQGFVVFCHSCDKQTTEYQKVDEAIQAWNEGKVE